MKLYELNGTLYRAIASPSGIDFVKAGKKVAPGQLDLFGGDSGDRKWTQEDEDKHPRDHGKFTSKGGGNTYQERLESSWGGAKNELDQKVAAHKKRISQMNFAELEDHAPEVEYDDYHTEHIQALDEHARAGEDETDETADHLDRKYDDSNMMGYENHVKELNHAHAQRIEELEEKVDHHIEGALSDFQDYLDNAIDPDKITSLDQWEQIKGEVGDRYKAQRKASLGNLRLWGASAETIDDFMEQLHDSYEEALDQMSSDPEDWEDNDSDDSDDEGDTYDRHFGEFESLANSIKKLDIPTFEQWRNIKQRFTKQYQSVVAQAKKDLEESGADEDETSTLMDDLKDLYDETVGQFSDDPEDWED